MTVVGVGQYGHSGGKPKTRCQWFTGEKRDELKYGVFELDILEKV